MVKLVVIADDFTGALDTGIKFAKEGICTKAVIGSGFSFSRIPAECEVLAVDAETRHLQQETAYRIVYSLAKYCVDHQVEYIYKKTDSALRGCVGGELAALVDAAGCDVEFIPALPKEKRITVNGIQYIDGIPVSESVFGKDPFEPVRYSRVADIIHEVTEKAVVNVKYKDEIKNTNKPGIMVYDAVTDEDINRIAQELLTKGNLRVMAGCAGFASCLPDILSFPRGGIKKPRRTRSVFVVCGSVNAIAVKQLMYAQRKGFKRYSLNGLQKLQPDYLELPDGKAFLNCLERSCRGVAPVILDAFSENAVEETAYYAKSIGVDSAILRERVAKRIGEFVQNWLGFELDDTLVITGGDTVYAFLSQLGDIDIEPVCEVAPGAVLFNLKTGERQVQVVCKSGGLGDEKVLTDVAEKIMRQGGWEIEEEL